MTPVATIDALGRRCPIPVIELAKHITDVAVGDALALVADDEGARIDIPAWCRLKGHEYLGHESADVGTTHVVRRVK